MTWTARLGIVVCCLMLVGCAKEERVEGTAPPATPGAASAKREQPQERPREKPRVAAGAGEGVEQAIRRIRREAGIPALAVAVVKGGKVVRIVADGVRAQGSKARVQEGDKFHLGSNTKAMTATLAAVLVKRGVLSWKLTLAKGFPELAGKMHADYRGVTLEQLLAHRGGTLKKLTSRPEVWGPLRQGGKPVMALRRQFAAQILTRPPETKPGTTYAYSNAGYILAGALMEARTKTSWEALMRQHVFGPLKMTSCGFGPPGRAGALTQPQGHRGRIGALTPVEPGPLADNPAALGPAGTVHCSLADWAKLIAAHMSGARGVDGFLPAAVFKFLHRPRSQKPRRGHALGWTVLKRGWAEGIALYHNGSNTMFYAVVWAAPARDLAFLAAANCGLRCAARAVDKAIGTLVKTYAPRKP